MFMVPCVIRHTINSSDKLIYQSTRRLEAKGEREEQEENKTNKEGNKTNNLNSGEFSCCYVYIYKCVSLRRMHNQSINAVLSHHSVGS